MIEPSPGRPRIPEDEPDIDLAQQPTICSDNGALLDLATQKVVNQLAVEPRHDHRINPPPVSSTLGRSDIRPQW